MPDGELRRESRFGDILLTAWQESDYSAGGADPHRAFFADSQGLWPDGERDRPQGVRIAAGHEQSLVAAGYQPA
jgi:hypothetical protein